MVLHDDAHKFIFTGLPGNSNWVESQPIHANINDKIKLKSQQKTKKSIPTLDKKNKKEEKEEKDAKEEKEKVTEKKNNNHYHEFEASTFMENSKMSNYKTITLNPQTKAKYSSFLVSVYQWLVMVWHYQIQKQI